MLNRIYLYIIIGLLHALSLTQSFGQASSPIVPKEGIGWKEAFVEGGYLRTRDAYTGLHVGPWYVKVDGGLSDLISANYVDGYSVGPAATWGYVSEQGWRLELDEEVRWAFSREALSCYGALSYIWPAERQAQVSVFGGRISRSFDPDPIMPNEHSLLASGLFGWDKQKYYLLTNVGVRTKMAVGNGFGFDASIQWRKTEQLVNHRHRNIFGVRSENNIPRLNGKDYEGFADDTHFHPLLDVALSWQPGQTLIVYNDLENSLESLYPKLTVRAITALPDDNLSLEFRLEQQYDGLSYMASAGWFPMHHQVRLYDFHHFDATRFPWMTQRRISWFSLLDEYELSTDRGWAEAHVEYCDNNFLFSRWINTPEFCDFVQIHEAVACSRSHTELSYGWAFDKNFRVGFSLGWDNLKYDGIAFNLIISK